MKKVITINNIEYTVLEEQNRIERIINNCKLVIIYCPNLFGTAGWDIFTLDKDGCTPIDKKNPNYLEDKTFKGIKDYVENKRNPIFYKVSHSDIIRGLSDFWKIFKKTI